MDWEVARMNNFFNKDNLYKFVFIAFSFLLVYVLHDYNIKIYELQILILDSEKSIELLENDPLNSFQNQISLKYELKKVDFYNSWLDSITEKTWFLSILCLVSIIISGYFWYNRVQVYNDFIIKREKKKYDL